MQSNRRIDFTMYNISIQNNRLCSILLKSFMQYYQYYSCFGSCCYCSGKYSIFSTQYMLVSRKSVSCCIFILYLTIMLNSLILYVLELIFWSSLDIIAISSANFSSLPQYFSDSCLVAVATIFRRIQSFCYMMCNTLMNKVSPNAELFVNSNLIYL